MGPRVEMPTEQEIEDAKANIRAHGIDPDKAERMFKSAKPCPRCGKMRMQGHPCKNCGAKAEAVPRYLRQK